MGTPVTVPEEHLWAYSDDVDYFPESYEDWDYESSGEAWQAETWA